MTKDSETLKDKPDEIHQREFKCDECEYICKKVITMKKHINTKHAEYQCKSGKLKFKTAIEAFKHTAQDHSSNI